MSRTAIAKRLRCCATSAVTPTRMCCTSSAHARCRKTDAKPSPRARRPTKRAPRSSRRLRRHRKRRSKPRSLIGSNRTSAMHGESDERTALTRKIDDVLAQQRELVDRLQKDQLYFQQLARSVWRVQEDERRRLARELHDGVGHSLTALIHLMAQASAALDRPDEARER